MLLFTPEPGQKRAEQQVRIQEGCAPSSVPVKATHKKDDRSSSRRSVIAEIGYNYWL